MKKPVISVILSVRNEEKYINYTLYSILSQVFSDFELIIINDGSIDRTKIILDQYASVDNRIKVVDNTISLGIAASVNKGLNISKGKYIARIDAGDIADPYRLQKQINYMETHIDTFVLGSWAYFINIKKEAISEWKVPCEINDKILYKQNGVIQPTVLIRRELFEKIGGYNYSYVLCEDYELWARTLKNKLKINNIQEFLTSVMTRPEGMSTKYKRGMVKYTFKVKLKYLFYFRNFWNFIYTLRSLIALILPLGIFNYFAMRYGERLSGRTIVRKTL